MSRKPVVVVGLVAAVAGAGLWWALRGAPTPPAADDAVAEPGAERAENPEPYRAFAVPAAPAPPAAAPAREEGSLEGEVVSAEGHRVAGATVFLESRRTSARVVSDAQGRFASGPLPSAVYSVVAALGELVSDRLGEVPLAPGEHVRGLRLTLAGGASLEGTVRDQADLLALASCSVQLPQATEPLARCDRDGRFRLGPLPPGPLVLRVTAPGYAPRDVTVDLARRARSTADVLLGRGATLVGTVVDPASRPVPGVPVSTAHYSLAATSGQASAAESATATDRNGRFVLEGVAPGRVSVRARAPGYAEARSPELDVGRADRREGLVLRLTTGGAVAGRVQTAQGEPVAGAAIEALRLADGAPAGADTSDATGGFRLDGLEAGGYSVSANAPQGRALAPSVEVGERDEAQVTLVLGAAAISGRVVDASARPVPGALVSAAPLEGGGLAGRAAATGEDGRFRLEGLAGSSFRVEARVAGRSPVERRGVAPGAEVELVLGGDGALEGTVTGPDGAPVTDFVLTIVPAPGAAPGPVAGRFQVLHLVAPDGAWRVEPLAEGAYEVRAAAPGLASATAAATVRAGATARAELRLGAGATLQGRVLDEKEAPVAGCRVREDGMRALFARAGDDERTSVSDAAGAWRLAGLSPGPVAVVATCPGGDFAWGRARVGPAPSVLDLRLRTGHRYDTNGEFGGIGAVLSAGPKGVYIRSVAEGGPAFLAGLAAGDEVLALDGAPVAGASLPDVIGRIRGPLGTSVVLDVRRASSGTIFRAVAERRRVVVQ